jgi:hypothetical protein
MRSNVCKIENGTRDLAAILQESERVAEYNRLTDKQTLQLRLLCEEVDGMLPNIIDDFSGSLWIDYDNGVCKVNVSIKIPEMTSVRKRELVEISSNKKNASAIGIVGKIRSAVEDFLLSEDEYARSTSVGLFHPSTGYSEGVDYSYIWSLEQYKNTVNEESKAVAWDELEKSVIASVADDVIVGVKGNQADIIIVKKFA